MINISDNDNDKIKNNNDEDISRRTGIKKLGYAAFASITLFLLLNNPTRVYAQGPESRPIGGGGTWDDDKSNQDQSSKRKANPRTGKWYDDRKTIRKY